MVITVVCVFRFQNDYIYKMTHCLDFELSLFQTTSINCNVNMHELDLPEKIEKKNKKIQGPIREEILLHMTAL